DADKKYWRENHLPIANMVEISCLAHDIGNPPFGHFGEAAIKEWANSPDILTSLNKSLGVINNNDIINNILGDFVNFDGNPQGFRILTKLQGDDGLNGLNLTYSQLVSFLKYVYCPSDKPKSIDEKHPFSKKIGFFDTEKEVVYSAWDNLNMPKNKRHPLSFLMEASDDISYCISDIEDGIEKNIINEDDFFNFVIDGLNYLKHKFPDKESVCIKFIEILEGKKKNIPTSKFLYFKTSLSNFLVAEVARKFIEKYYLYMSLSAKHTLINKNDFEYHLLKILKDYTSKYLFTSYEAEKMELSGFSIIKGILNEYLAILSLTKEKFISLVTKILIILMSLVFI
ncbi:deoxyguanosinetriphosphate triphosphohydrolase, partial [Shigella flexneri 1235-66]